MAVGTLASIIAKVRRLSASPDTRQIPDSAIAGDPNSVGIKDYINSFYLYDFPAQFRSLKLKDKYTFNTVRGIDTYAFDSEKYTTVEMPATCAKRNIPLYNDPWSFYGANFNWQYQEFFSTGNGTTGPYSGTTTGNPILRSVNNNPAIVTYPASRVQNILITANVDLGDTMNVTDDGRGNLIGNCSAGVIDYETGQISGLIFDEMIPSGNQIQIQYNPVQLNIPLGIMFFQNQFTLRPVPDRGYTIELIAYRQPSQALSETGANLGVPELVEWWECIAVGAAKKIYEDRLDMDGVQMMDKMLKERYSICETRTYAQLGKQRVATIFADQLNYGNNGFGAINGAN